MGADPARRVRNRPDDGHRDGGGRGRARAAARAAAPAALGVLKDTLGRARDAGGIDVLLSLGEVRGVPISASCLVSYLERDPKAPLDGLHAELARGGDQVTWAGIAGSPAIPR